MKRVKRLISQVLLPHSKQPTWKNKVQEEWREMKMHPNCYLAFRSQQIFQYTSSGSSTIAFRFLFFPCPARVSWWFMYLFCSGTKGSLKTRLLDINSMKQIETRNNFPEDQESQDESNLAEGFKQNTLKHEIYFRPISPRHGDKTRAIYPNGEIP